ncbi:sulfiredoxin [Saccharomyces cerevisiae]|nr:sulfiredoxin [Saccharomyces cerevisiae]
MSLQSNSVKPTEIPLSEIRRPLAPVLDPQKIDAMVATMKGIPTASKTCSLEQAPRQIRMYLGSSLDIE